MIVQRVGEAEGRRLAALDLEGDHRAAARHLPLRELGLRMIGAAGIEHARDAAAARRGNRRSSRRAGHLLRDAQRQRLQRPSASPRR